MTDATSVTEEEADRAFNYLAETDEQVAQLVVAEKAQLHVAEETEKTAYLRAEGTVKERDCIAGLDPTYKEKYEKYLEVQFERRVLENRRKSAALCLDLWRTKEASRRVGG